MISSISTNVKRSACYLLPTIIKGRVLLTSWRWLLWPAEHFVWVCRVVLVVSEQFETFGSEGAAEVPLPDWGVSLSWAVATGLCPGLQGRNRLKSGVIILYEYKRFNTWCTSQACGSKPLNSISWCLFIVCYLWSVHLKDEDVKAGGVLSQSVFPGDAELCMLLVCPADTRILLAVNLGPQPRDEQWFCMRHFYGSKKNMSCLSMNPWSYLTGLACCYILQGFEPVYLMTLSWCTTESISSDAN